MAAYETPGPWNSILEVQAHHATREVDWFDANEFFATHIATGMVRGRFFVTSEQFEASDGTHPFPRLFTIRAVSDEGDITTVGKFQAHATLEEALSQVDAIIETQQEEAI